MNRQVADSACSATAYLHGVKANYGTIGFNAKTERSDCNAFLNPATRTQSLAKWAQDQGMATGLVTTSRITHATPAGIYSHTADRNWESDKGVIKSKCDPKKTPDIARQLIESEVGQKLNVIFGGGRREFRNETHKDEDGLNGYRVDGRDLIAQWLADRKTEGVSAEYVWNKQMLKMININKTDNILGLFAFNHMLYNLEVVNQSLTESKPDLLEMTEIAIKMMEKEPKGYFLFVEGALIDLAHHDNWAKKAMDETVEFSRALQMVVDRVNSNDTLIVATADHAHTMSYNGYPVSYNYY